MNFLGFANSRGADRATGPREPAGAPPAASAIARPAKPLFPPTAFGESTFADFIAGAGGHLSAPIPKPATKGTDPQPYFRSERTQGFNERTAQFKSELFSGRTRMEVSKTGAYRHRTDVPTRFDPAASAERVRYYGTAGNGTADADATRERFVSSGKMTNALPFEQLRVGPAVGKGADVASADGFHPYLRVMPNNVGGYKKNTLPGRTGPAKNQIDEGSSRDFEFQRKMPKKFYDMKRRPLAKSGDPTAGICAPMEIPAEPRSTDFITRGQVNPGDLRCPRGPSVLAPCGYGGAPLNATSAWAAGGQAAPGAADFAVGATRAASNRAIDGGRPAPGGQAGIRGQTGPGMGVEGYRGDVGRFEKLARDGSKSFGDYLNNQASSSRAVAPVGVGADMVSTPQTTTREQTNVKPHNIGVSAITGEEGSVAAPTMYGTFKQIVKEAKRTLVTDGFIATGHIDLPDENTFGEFWSEAKPTARPEAGTIGPSVRPSPETFGKRVIE